MTEIVYNKNGVEFDIDAIVTDLNGKADVDLSNTISSLSDSFLSKLMPDYANGIEGTLNSTSWAQVAKDSFVCVWGLDSYAEDYRFSVSPNSTGTPYYIVGYRCDDYNANTQATSATFFVPKGWYFSCGAEAGSNYRIYPLKGAE